ncbi:hypothetical protein [Klebsiella sp. BIGb0407]|uniref:hypothetical protein n=1 Tax=Klebsiella sp. BIGb0407 TaxID=2940603 RepID=UPI002169437F|nr:hypothetical protein [Klebsiella sp. BIGb0407]MCS3434253.1 hypothetical protein [Klebsiella sp. BIGb0407]
MNKVLLYLSKSECDKIGCESLNLISLVVSRYRNINPSFIQERKSKSSTIGFLLLFPLIISMTLVYFASLVFDVHEMPFYLVSFFILVGTCKFAIDLYKKDRSGRLGWFNTDKMSKGDYLSLSKNECIKEWMEETSKKCDSITYTMINNHRYLIAEREIIKDDMKFNKSVFKTS